MTGACSEFLAFVKSSNEYYYNRSNAELRTYMQQTPSPTAQCAAGGAVRLTLCTCVACS
jgi:hypothetical protein